MKKILDRVYRYASVFDPDSGKGVRTGVFDHAGMDTGSNPFRGSFPELLDIGIMGHCAHGESGLCARSGVECYQDGWDRREPNMPLDLFKKIIDQCKDRTFQVALGGRGDPDMHEEFPAILRYAADHGVVPNFTTSGFGFSAALLPVIKECCGAVAVSWYRSEYTIKTIEMLLSYGIRTNIHYCLSAGTIDEGIERMTRGTFPAGINRVIFLLHKPVGRGSTENVLKPDDPRVQHFFSLFDQPENADRSGFDSCSVPGLLRNTGRLWGASIEPCEAGRFSAYISPDYKLYPCSFEQNPFFGVGLHNHTVESAWNSAPFIAFRARFLPHCGNCRHHPNCLGGCPILPSITLCEERPVTEGWFHEGKS